MQAKGNKGSKNVPVRSPSKQTTPARKKLLTHRSPAPEPSEYHTLPGHVQEIICHSGYWIGTCRAPQMEARHQGLDGDSQVPEVNRPPHPQAAFRTPGEPCAPAAVGDRPPEVVGWHSASQSGGWCIKKHLQVQQQAVAPALTHYA